MGRFVRPTDTVRISLAEFDGSEDWVDVRGALSWRDMLELRALAIGGATQGGDGGVELRVDPWRAQLELLARAIVGWSFRAADGDPAPIPVSRSAIEQLDPALGDWLAQRIDALYQGSQGNSSRGDSRG
jgi:hypothetical protein